MFITDCKIKTYASRITQIHIKTTKSMQHQNIHATLENT